MKICRQALGNRPEVQERSGRNGIHSGVWRGPGAQAEPRALQAGWMQRPNTAWGHQGGRQLKPASGFA